MPAEPRFASEFYARIVRALALIGVPLIAVPLAVAGKRSPVWRRMVVALALLVVFQNLTKTVEGSADLGRVSPAFGLWGLCAVYFALGLWLYISTTSQGSDSPARKLFVWIDRGLRRVKDLISRTFGRKEDDTSPPRKRSV